MTIELTKDCALVLVGAQGSGKTRLAEKIASKYGTSVQADGITRGWLLDRFTPDATPLVLIYSDPTPEDVRFSEKLITGCATYRPPYGRRHLQCSAFVIITTTDERWLKVDDRRYHVLPIAAARRLMGEPS